MLLIKEAPKSTKRTCGDQKYSMSNQENRTRTNLAEAKEEVKIIMEAQSRILSNANIVTIFGFGYRIDFAV